MVAAQTGAPKGPASGGMGDAAGRLLAALWEASGAAAARELFGRLAALPPAGGDMYRRMLQLEGQELEALGQEQQQQQQQQQQQRGGAGGASRKAARKEALQRVRRVLEAAVEAYGDFEPSFWLAYARFEHRHGKQGAGAIYWRAVKALRDADAFVQEYRSSVCSEDVQ
jgi:hypothetical protein